MKKHTDNAKAMTLNRGVKARGFLFASLFNNTKNCLTFTPQNKPEKKKDNNYTHPFCILGNHL